jgi:small subunit ribosomal protein S16
MAVKIRLKRMGRTHRPFYRVNAVVDRNARDGRVLEQLGHYDPIESDKDKQVSLDLDRVKHWLDVGAIPSETVSTLIKRSGMEHKMLRLPRPGKPKKAEEDKADGDEK